ncbi:MAG TPA: PilT/PilU family type 4a pilus ATPase [Patescibacteria group bacterium]|nr:PilT/PilU family type 4a pilus ATPase [Patescibacteria group bacterium]
MDIQNILKLAAEKKASDVHALVGYPPIFRIDGELLDANKVSKKNNFSLLTSSDLSGFIDTLLPDEVKKRFLTEKDLDYSYEIDGVRYRLNFSYEKGEMKLVARVIKNEEPTLEALGLPPVVAEILNYRQGLVLLTGPTGCGKSTTLAAMINHINSTKTVNIVTLEDPIEYVFKPKGSVISQRQLGEDMLSFESGLKHILRQDPNIVMLGEMRDLETISTALTIAETGHLVLATLHTFSAAQTIDRIIDIFPAHQQNQVKSQLSMVLRAVISQRLLAKKGGGRVAAREILINNSASANLIREGKIAQINSVIETGSSLGMVTLENDIKNLYQNGIITQEVAESYFKDLGDIKKNKNNKIK